MTETTVTEPGQSGPPAYGEDPFYERVRSGADIRALFDILVRGKWIVLASILALTIPVAAYSLISPSMYRSYSILLIDKTDTDLASVLPEAQSIPLLRNERNLGNELLLLEQSIPLAENVASQLIALGTVPGTDRPLTILAPREDGTAPTALEVAFRLQTSFVKATYESGDADALRVVVSGTDPIEAALIANAYAESFADLTQDQSRSGASASREFLEGQVAAQSARLTEADEAVEDYMLREGAVALEEGTESIVQQIAALDAQLDQTVVTLQTKRAELAALRGQLARLESSLGDRFSANLDDELSAARARVQALREELEVFYSRSPALRNDPDPPANIARLRDEFQLAQRDQAALAEQLADQALATSTGPNDMASGFVRAAQLRSEISASEVEIQGLQAQSRQVRARLADYERQLADIPAQSIELAQLQRQRVAAEQLYGALEQNLQQARVAEQSQLGYAQVIRPAFPADRPYAPVRGRNVLLALLSGFIFGAILAVGKVRLDHRLHTPDDLSNFGPPIIGTVPSTTELVADEFGGADRADVNGRLIDTHIVSLLNPMSTASESYRALRTNIQFSRPDVVVQTILVTSSNPSEGKSVTATNLAVVFAQSGRRVLLVDADLRRPTVHKKLGIPREPGVVQELFSDTGLELEGLHQLADDLYVLPAGSIAPNPSELIGSRRMRELMDDLRSKFDIVIFDAPPVLAATDAVLLSTQCDVTLLIVRAGQTKDYEVESALSALAGVGTRPGGLVLNAFDVRQAYGYRYKYAYRYGSKYSYGAPEPSEV